MNREKQIVDYLDSKQTFVRNSDLQKKLSISENTVRSAIKFINLDAQKNGFQIVHVRSKGYKLQIHDIRLYRAYQNSVSADVDVTHAQRRQEAYLYYLLQAKGYITLDWLSQMSDISRTTITKDLNRLECRLSQLALKLERKRHYGLKITGDEVAIRQAFSKYVIGSDLYIEPIREYRDFFARVNRSVLKEEIYQILRKHAVLVSDLAFDNLWQHYTVIIYRCTQNNYITFKKSETSELKSCYYTMSKEIASYTEEKLSVLIPECEIEFFALDIQSKCVIESMSKINTELLENSIRDSLRELDAEFYTSFCEDSELINNLLIHIYPLISRVNYDLQLSNPIINEIHSDYVNVFTMTLRFLELLETKIKLTKLTKDEVGFITLHFAASIEKRRQTQLNQLQKIVVICSTGRGSAALVKIKLESIFGNAKVVPISEHDLASVDHDLPEIFLSTIPFANSYMGVPVIQIKQLLNEDEIERIRENVVLQMTYRNIGSVSDRIVSLFKEEYFQCLETGNYMELIEEAAKLMVQRGDADPSFTQYVLQRENRYPTIFMNGIATPHPVQLNAICDTVGVILLKKPANFEGQEVALIFLINLKAESLFLHQELQRFILKLIENEKARQNILLAKSFDAFLFEMKKIL